MFFLQSEHFLTLFKWKYACNEKSRLFQSINFDKPIKIIKWMNGYLLQSDAFSEVSLYIIVNLSFSVQIWWILLHQDMFFLWFEKTIWCGALVIQLKGEERKKERKKERK